MPCGSTVYSSTNTLDATSPSLRDLGWFWKIPLAWLDRIATRWERHRQYKQLLQLDDRMLSDIGLSRTTVQEVRRSDLYMMAWRDSR